jgi:hypothetical protein
MPAGGVLLFDDRLYHGADTNNNYVVRIRHLRFPIIRVRHGSGSTGYGNQRKSNRISTPGRYSSGSSF